VFDVLAVERLVQHDGHVFVPGHSFQVDMEFVRASGGRTHSRNCSAPCRYAMARTSTTTPMRRPPCPFTCGAYLRLRCRRVPHSTWWLCGLSPRSSEEA
jgi:hypothetical protein